MVVSTEIKAFGVSIYQAHGRELISQTVREAAMGMALMEGGAVAVSLLDSQDSSCVTVGLLRNFIHGALGLVFTAWLNYHTA